MAAKSNSVLHCRIHPPEPTRAGRQCCRSYPLRRYIWWDLKEGPSPRWLPPFGIPSRQKLDWPLFWYSLVKSWTLDFVSGPGEPWVDWNPSGCSPDCVLSLAGCVLSFFGFYTASFLLLVSRPESLWEIDRRPHTFSKYINKLSPYSYGSFMCICLFVPLDSFKGNIKICDLASGFVTCMSYTQSGNWFYVIILYWERYINNHWIIEQMNPEFSFKA